MNSTQDIRAISIEHELKQSYLDYSMSVIVGRALPDVRDGLKPVHRRVLYAMHQLGNDWNKPYKKSARVVGDVIGKYHPHGESAVYDTIVRMAQPFSLRYLLVDGQGNFGSVDGDAAAAMRYTEVRMSKITHALLADLDKETVDFTPNYDESELAPLVFPTRVPNLLINGTSGIAVGMATNIPPHNLTEILNACIALIDNPNLGIIDLLRIIPGPDFPTAGIINGRSGIHQAYKTGKGKILIRARTDIETLPNKKTAIVITELPYQVNKARLIEKIAELVKDKRVEGISELRDESDKDGLRVVIEVKKNESPEIILNNLFTLTPLQQVYGINMVALVDNQPRTLSLLEILNYFLQHRRDVVTRRTLFDLKKAQKRGHILEGLSVALANIDKIIQIIKSSPNSQVAKDKLTETHWEPGVVSRLQSSGASECSPSDLPDYYGLSAQGYRMSPEQAQAILDMRLHRLTAMEQDKIYAEYQDIIKLIHELLNILNSPDKLRQVIRTELLEIKEEFGDARRTEISDNSVDLSNEDLIEEESVIVTLSHEGYIKYQPLSLYQAQKRGGKGKTATRVKDEDFIEKLIVTQTHDTLLCFSSIGKVYWLKAYELPLASRISKGRPIVNLLPLSVDENEKITAILPIKELNGETYIFMATELGTVKKVPISDFSRPRSSGIIAIKLQENDHLVGVDVTNGKQDIMLFTDAGKVNRFNESEIRPMGRNTQGVRGIKLKEGQKVTDLIIVKEGGSILIATENGYGKRTSLDEYRTTGRGGQGVISIQVTERNGKAVNSAQVYPNDEVMLISNQGMLVRIRVDEIAQVSRNTQGVKLINLNEGESLVSLQRVEEINPKEDENNSSILEPEIDKTPDDQVTH